MSGRGRRWARSKRPSSVLVPPRSPAKIMRWIIVNRVPAPDSAHISKRQLLERYKHVREDHLRYMQKWGLIRPSHREHGESSFSFADVSVGRQADEAVGGGAKFRSVLRNLLASRDGQLTLDFRLDAQHAKVL